MHNREIISFNLSRNPNFNQTREMLEKAFEKYDRLEGLIFHSDQGWQYQMSYYHQESNGEELSSRCLEEAIA